jgi:hypothetical protein
VQADSFEISPNGKSVKFQQHRPRRKPLRICQIRKLARQLNLTTFVLALAGWLPSGTYKAGAKE